MVSRKCCFVFSRTSSAIGRSAAPTMYDASAVVTGAVTIHSFPELTWHRRLAAEASQSASAASGTRAVVWDGFGPTMRVSPEHRALVG